MRIAVSLRRLATRRVLAVAVPAALGAVLLAVIETLDFDRRWSDAFFRPELGGWYLRRAWWAEVVLHRGGRMMVVLVALVALALALAARGRPRLASWRRPALYVVLTLASCSALVGILKALSPRPCPWDVDRYGGRWPHWSLLEPAPPDAVGGRCFPSAHAAAGFSLFALYFATRDRSRRVALWMLAGGLGTGTAFGFAQVARGAHFASHNVVSALICWYVALGLYEWILSPVAGERERTGGGRKVF